MTDAPPPAPAVVAAPPPAAPEAAVAAPAPAYFCLPAPLPFSRFAVCAIAPLLIALTWACWHAMAGARSLADAVVVVHQGPSTETGTLPPAARLVDDERFARAVARWPQHERTLLRARASALAGAREVARALETYARLERLHPLGLEAGDAVARATVLADAQRWREALDGVALIDLGRAGERDRAAAIALDARCRLALRAAGSAAAPPRPR